MLRIVEQLIQPHWSPRGRIHPRSKRIGLHVIRITRGAYHGSSWRRNATSRGNKPAQRIVVRIVVHFVSPRVGVMWKCLAASAMARARPAPPPCRDADLGARKQTKIGRKLRLVRLNFTRVLAGRGLDSQRARPVVPPQSRYAARRRRMSAIGVCVQPVSATPLVVYRLAFRSPRSFADVD
jgi:hypothetical protein